MEHKGFDQYTADLLTVGRYIADLTNIKSCSNDDYTELAQRFLLYYLKYSNTEKSFTFGHPLIQSASTDSAICSSAEISSNLFNSSS